MKKKKKIKYLVGGILLIAIIAGVYLFVIFSSSPAKQMETIRGFLSEAREKGAETYAPSEYKRAVLAYEQAMDAWKTENRKWFIFRDLRKISPQVDTARIYAVEMWMEAYSRRKEGKLQQNIAQLRSKMAVFGKVIAALPLKFTLKNEYARGKLLLNEAEIAVKKGKYAKGEKKYADAATKIEAAYQEAYSCLQKYFKALPRWQKEKENAIAFSRKNRSYVVVVEKFPSRCELYYKGVKKYSFEAELGKNWLGHKQREGDAATPEGEYKVVKKKAGAHTRYYKALLLDYPNEADRKNFSRRKKAGYLPLGTKIGGGIEIHGTGGRGMHWTDGCVALDNRDMDVLYQCLKPGDKVTIIGASLPLEQIVEKLN